MESTSDLRVKGFVLGHDFDGHPVGRHQPNINHVGIGYGDTAIRPVLPRIIGLGKRGRIRLSMNHDLATGIDTLCPGFRTILILSLIHI